VRDSTNVCGHPYSLQIGSQVSDLSERSPADTWTMEFDYFAPAAEAVIRRSQKAGVQMDFALLRHEVGPSEDDLHREALIRDVRRFGKIPTRTSWRSLGPGWGRKVDAPGEHPTGREDNAGRLVGSVPLG
jgi:hypothetical protein